MFKNKIEQVSPKQLYNLLKWQQLLTITGTIVIAFFVTKLESSGHGLLIALLMCVQFFLLGLQIAGRRFSNKIAMTMLHEKLDLVAYQEFNHYRHNGDFKVLKRHEVESVRLIDGQVAYLRGNFTDSIEIVDELNLNYVARFMRHQYHVTAIYYIGLSYLQLKQFDKAEEMIHKLKELTDKKELGKDLYPRVRAVETIKKGQVTDYFSTIKAENALAFLSNTYYEALNAMNSGDDKAAMELFKQISQKNPELFYVQEAKKYLADMEG